GGDDLERVPDRPVGAGAEVDRVVGFEHAAGDAERLDARFDVRTPFVGENRRSDRRLRAVRVESVDEAAEPAEFDDDIRRLRETTNVARPARKHPGEPAAIRSDPDRSA